MKQQRVNEKVKADLHDLPSAECIPDSTHEDTEKDAENDNKTERQAIKVKGSLHLNITQCYFKEKALRRGHRR